MLDRQTHHLQSRFLVFGSTLLAVLAIGGALAAAAQASPTWQIGGEAFAGRETFSSSASPFAISWRYGNAQTFHIACESEDGTGAIFAGDEGNSTFYLRGCHVDLAPSCRLPNPIKFEVKSETIEANGAVYDLFRPVVGTTFLTLEVRECALAGGYRMSGTFAGEAEPLGVELVERPLRFSEAIDEAAGAQLTIGNGGGSFEGEWDEALSGENAGREWGSE